MVYPGLESLLRRAGIVGDERPLLPREATAREKAAYIDYLDEFPEALGSLLVVGLGLP